MEEPWKSALSADAARPFDEYLPAPSAYPKLPLPVVPSFDEHMQFLANGSRLPRRAHELVARLGGLRREHARISSSPEALEEYLRRGIRSRVPFPYLLSGALVLSDERPALSGLDVGYALDRAARLVAAIRRFQLDFEAGKLAQERYGTHDAEMFQIWNLFGTSRSLLGRGRPVRVRAVAGVPYAAVLYRSCLTCIPLAAEDGTPLLPSRIRSLLEQVVEGTKAPASWREESPCSVSTLLPNHLGPALAALEESEPRFLAGLRNALFTVSLDLDERPESYAECGRNIQNGTPENRWYLSGTTLVVTGNARAGVLLNFELGLDGNIMSRFASEIDERARGLSTAEPDRRPAAAPLTVPFARPTGRKWQRVLSTTRRHVEDYRRRETGEHRIDIGRDRLQLAGVVPVDAFVLALEAAILEQTGAVPPVLQAVSQNRYRWGSLMGGNLATDEAKAFCSALNEARRLGLPPSRLEYDLYKTAEARAAKVTRTARDHCFLVNYPALSRPWRFYVASALVTLPFLSAQSFLLKVKPRRDAAGNRLAASGPVFLSHPSQKANVPVSGRPGGRSPGNQCWLHYQIGDDRISLFVAPPTVPGIREDRLVSSLRENLSRIEALGLHFDRPAMLAREPRKVGTLDA